MNTHSHPIFRRIGQGFCGTVWAAPTNETEDTQAIKREDGGLGRSLYNDYIMHQKVLSTTQSRIRIPKCHQYIPTDNRIWWDTQIHSFPKGFEPCNVFVTDRIPLFPTQVREIVIDRYCPSALKLAIKTLESDRDCLIRPYLGRRRRLVAKSDSRFMAFGLRNYPLHGDQIEELELDEWLFVRVMAETMVGDHAVWILDFDCCRFIPLNEDGVKQAVSAFFRNDPFCPRPGRDNIQDQILWTAFKARFLEASEAILRGSPEAHLAALWIDLAEQRGSAPGGLSV